MKVKTALKQSKAHVKSGLKIWLVLLVVAIRWPNIFTWTIFAFESWYLIGDIVNIIHIKRQAQHSPDVLNETLN